MKFFVLLTIFLAFSSVSAQTKAKPKKKPKQLTTVYEVAQKPKPPQEDKPEWAHLTGNVSKDGRIQTVYRYQTDSLASIAPHVYKFWLEGTDTEKNISYRSLFLFEINCQTKEYRTTRVIAYDKDGTLMTDDKFKEAEFEEVVPGTPMMTIHSKICAIAEK